MTPYRRRRDREPPRTKSGYKGVIEHPWAKEKPWKAHIFNPKSGERLTLGYFATKEEAAREYNKKALHFYGPDTYLNRV